MAMERSVKGRRASKKGLRFPSRDALCAWLTQTAAGAEVLESVVKPDPLERTTNVEIVVTHLRSGRIGIDVWGPKWMRDFHSVSLVEIAETETAEQHALVCELADVDSERSMTLRLVERTTVQPLTFAQWLMNLERQIDAQAYAKAMRNMKGFQRT